jgi:hypothetical protein
MHCRIARLFLASENMSSEWQVHQWRLRGSLRKVGVMLVFVGTAEGQPHFRNPPQPYAERTQDIMLTNHWLQAFAM